MSICSRVFFCREIIGRFWGVYVSKIPFIFHPKYECLVVLSGSSVGTESACSAGDMGSIPGLGRFPGEGNAKTTPVSLPGKIPWTEEPGGLQSMGPQRVGYAWVTNTCTFSQITSFTLWKAQSSSKEYWISLVLKLFFFFINKTSKRNRTLEKTHAPHVRISTIHNSQRHGGKVSVHRQRNG